MLSIGVNHVSRRVNLIRAVRFLSSAYSCLLTLLLVQPLNLCHGPQESSMKMDQVLGTKCKQDPPVPAFHLLIG